MPAVKANGIQVEYDTFGDKSSPALLLIIGLGGQMIHWDEEFCRGLAAMVEIIQKKLDILLKIDEIFKYF